ncbi:hypothetical protein VTK26DRAFT_2719 [Humicola hyalothermophila]
MHSALWYESTCSRLAARTEKRGKQIHTVRRKTRRNSKDGPRLGLARVGSSAPTLWEERVQEGQDRVYYLQVSARLHKFSSLYLSVPLHTEIRKVKCDEAKPFCMRCTKTGRRCDGYLDAKAMAQRRRRSAGPGFEGVEERRAPLALLCDRATPDEKRAFHFFQNVTAPCLSADLDGVFWRVLVLQICHSEPAVKHAVLAVSSLHEGMMQANTPTLLADAEGRSSFALFQYNRAIAHLLDQMRTLDAKPLVPLLTCVLFVFIELMQNKDRESLLHLEQGRQILSLLGRKEMTRNPDIDLIKQHLVPMYTRLSLTSLLFGGNPVAIPTELKTLTEIPMVFDSIDNVRYALCDFMDECLRFAKRSHAAKFGHVSSQKLQDFAKEQDYLLGRLAKFKVAFSLYQSTRARDASSGAISLIQIHVHTSFIWVSTALNTQETAFDDYLDTFSAIIPLATQFINSLAAGPTRQEQQTADTRRFLALFASEMGVIAPLYFVAAKCRHPAIRRAALRLLRRYPERRGNLWRANVMAAIAERSMRLEEKHLNPSHSESRAQSRAVSPPELGPYPSISGGDASEWADNPHDIPFMYSLGPGEVAVHPVFMNKPHFDGYDATHAQMPPSSSSSAVTGSLDSGAVGADLAGNLAPGFPVDPTLFLDAAELSSAGYSFSPAPSVASSLEELGSGGGGGGAAATAVVSGSTAPYIDSSGHPPTGGAWSSTSAQQSPPGIALEPATPMDAAFSMAMPMHRRSHPGSRSQSQQPSHGSPSVRSEGSPAANPIGMDMEMGPVPVSGLNLGGFHHHHHHHHHHQYGEMSLGPDLAQHQQQQQKQQSPTAVTRSAEAPFGVPERFRVHELIIGPDKEDGTSWVMMFRKLGGLQAEWDVFTEWVAVT